MKNTICSEIQGEIVSPRQFSVRFFVCVCFQSLQKMFCVFNINENSYDNQLYHNWAALLLPQEQDSWPCSRLQQNQAMVCSTRLSDVQTDDHYDISLFRYSNPMRQRNSSSKSTPTDCFLSPILTYCISFYPILSLFLFLPLCIFFFLSRTCTLAHARSHTHRYEYGYM